MKKSFVVFSLLVAVLFISNSTLASENKVLQSDIKEAHFIDDTKMQEKENKIDKKEVKKLEKEAKKLEEKQRKENDKKIKFEQKEAEKNAKVMAKEAKKNAKSEAKLAKEQEKIAQKEAKKLEKEKNKEIKAVVEESNKETEKEEIKEVSEIKEETKEITEEKEVLEEETVEFSKEEITEEIKEEKVEPTVYRKNLTFEDIDKNAVSINEFLQFSNKQNEKFSIFYYKTLSKLNAYTKAIAKKETQMKENKNSNLSTKEKLEKAKKLEKEYDNLLRNRDDFYNSSLEKFNSILNKKQQMKWELLQQMGYRFFPEF